ncbi:hypothetical protein A3H10_02375 [Candidatus Uhrbacteria bacterium RIFCSPLOWO2_12_FULL_46_10]|uniref:Uncharacterized protein n=1 Tax=Candidatus Uhrbacteria bacterium RIFCSPLOWO2_01_FULL_47_25 TaxID=1802402 RepID=A0A1F7UWE7_9BACT|nr:MAG: hypothetical protein UX68_C0003G0020 [Parcubacteria group bacterium GW2011_GWA2_46_9]OGL59998.1 MAG: hypothetical protein A2752_03580 [Candidatus Uhrbacteria bacterium RIFCSPHIGHO2_01_FULL_46_23]OGL69496.1 MAG: hypothetical protein A3D60_01550 [Candidatus Uhrbacteria bacterium RIFCSPHIGHO2_02_FULL_47_29]OGL75234.1 MAG: hypothetical protein A3E96_02790 [Candidatus Uhrbacteria bacterium RIFCSPHIGHO2_12_FULL_46_13]OGL82623.1 MAG: hypothetical protein A2936_04795 [Candidatus Uhrbacteria bac
MERQKLLEAPQPEPTIFGKVVRAYRAFGEDASLDCPGGTWLAPIMWMVSVAIRVFAALVCFGALIKFLEGPQ